MAAEERHDPQPEVHHDHQHAIHPKYLFDMMISMLTEAKAMHNLKQAFGKRSNDESYMIGLLQQRTHTAIKEWGMSEQRHHEEAPEDETGPTNLESGLVPNESEKPASEVPASEMSESEMPESEM
jgi:hypothetical protein